MHEATLACPGSSADASGVFSVCSSDSCCRLSFGIGADGQVAMKVVSRGDSVAASETVHSMIQEA